MTQTLKLSAPFSLPTSSFAVLALIVKAAQRLRQIGRAIKHRRETAILAGLDDRMLADIGLSRSDLRDAYAEPLWRDPTDILASRAGDRRATRVAVAAPSLVPEVAFMRPRMDRPARFTV